MCHNKYSRAYLYTLAVQFTGDTEQQYKNTGAHNAELLLQEMHRHLQWAFLHDHTYLQLEGTLKWYNDLV